MDILVPAALAFSAIIPIILLLYFMRPKRQERVVGSTLLWQQAAQDLQASRPWQRLRITPLLLLQLLAALVIVLILTRPAIFTKSPISGNTVIILQASASMQATDITPSRFESAKNSISDMIDAMGANDHISLMLMAHTPQVLATASQDKAFLHTQLQRARVTNQDADLAGALSLATSLAFGQANTQILVIGDGHVTNTASSILTSPFPVRYIAVGTDAPNVALMALSSRNLQGDLVALAQVVNYSHQQRAIPVELNANGKLISVKTITLAAGGSGSVQWEHLATSTRYLDARLLTQDAMSVDHEAWAIVGGALQARVLLVTKGNLFLETALRLQPTVSLFETTPAKYASSMTYDLTIFDGYIPPTLPSGNLLFVNPPAGSYAFGTSGQAIHVSQISAGNDTLNLLSNVDLSEIHTLRASHLLKPELWAQSIIATPETPLLIAGAKNNRRMAVIGFDLHDTDLPLQPAFPLLVNNMMTWLLPPPVNGDGQVAADTPVTVQTWPGANRVTITSPDQQTTTVGPPFPVLPYDKTDTTGIYQVTQHVQSRTLIGAFTVNLFNASQSNLAPAKTLPILHSTTITTSGNTVSRQLREIWPWIAAFLLFVLCAEWWLFSRNYKQQLATPARQDKDARAWSRGAAQRRLTSSNSFITALQDQAQDRYRATKKRMLKAIKRMRGKVKPIGIQKRGYRR